MSGANIRGAQQGATIKQKHRPNYSTDAMTGRRRMEKESALEIAVRAPQTTRLKIGIRVKAYQEIESLRVAGKGNNLTIWKEAGPFPAGQGPLSGNQPPIPTQLEAILPTTNPDGSASGDKWVGFVALYDPNLHGTRAFDTDLVVQPVDLIPANGCQPIVIAFTTEGNRFETDHYLVATSVLPGENSTFNHMAITLGAAGGKKAKATSKASKAKASKSRRASQSAPTRRRRKR